MVLILGPPAPQCSQTKALPPNREQNKTKQKTKTQPRDTRLSKAGATSGGYMMITETDSSRPGFSTQGSLGPILWFMHLARGASGS